MTEDETGWSEKGKSSGRGKRPPRDSDAEDSATPSRPSKRTSDDSADDSTIVRRPAASDDAGARKVARAAATAGQRDASFASRLGFPALIALICILGSLTVLYAWSTREAAAQPRQGGVDHWHAVYGFYDCTLGEGGGHLPQFQSADDATGIHSHGDGIMHIHPFIELASGVNAQMHHFFTEMRLDVNTERIVLDDGRELVAGTECLDGSGPAEIRTIHWDFDFQALSGMDETSRIPSEPPTEIFTEDLGSVKFNNDREVYIIAFAGADAEIPLPPADRFETLNNVSAQLEYNPTELLPQDSGVDEVDTEEGEG